jgi:hypothetical protein
MAVKRSYSMRSVMETLWSLKRSYTIRSVLETLWPLKLSCTIRSVMFANRTAAASVGHFLAKHAHFLCEADDNVGNEMFLKPRLEGRCLHSPIDSKCTSF